MNHVINGIIFALIYLAGKELRYQFTRWMRNKRMSPEALQTISVAEILASWKPGSQEWTWAEECDDLKDRPETKRIETWCLIAGWDFADSRHPVILGDDGRVWDGHHRICLAIKHGVSTLNVIRMDQ